MSSFRAAIWVAVSTQEQAAEDKVSLEVQEEKCRQLIESRDWQETAGPYVVPGQSRTRWVNLRDAEQAIPELRAMLDDAQAGRFNLLVLYDFNRLRDLLDPVSRTLSAYGCQVYAVSQPVEPLNPERFDPYASDASSMMQGLSQIISRAQISDLRRKYRFAMPRRVTELGLPATHIPYGYRKPPGRETDRKAVPVQVPEQVLVLHRIRDLYMEGYSVKSIAGVLNEDLIPSPKGKRWNHFTVHYILNNPFYAGKVFFGRSRAKIDPRTGKRSRIRRIPRSQWTIGEGRHDPIWTQEEFDAIQREMARRRRKNTGKYRRTHRFTSLLRCETCGSTMHRWQDGPRSEPDRAIYRCSNKDDHDSAAIVESQAIRQVTKKLQELLADVDLPIIQEHENRNGRLETAQRVLEQVGAKQARYQRAFGDGLMSYEDFAARLSEVEAEADQARRVVDEISNREKHIQELKQQRGKMQQILDAVPDYLELAPRKEVNQALREFIEAIVVSPDGEIIRLKLR